MSDTVKITSRWCLTEDRSRVVPETDPDGRWLHWRVGDMVSRAEAERLGAVEPPAPEPEPVEPPAPPPPPKRKPGRPPGSKNRPLSENKGGGLSVKRPSEE